MKAECIIVTWLARDQPGFLDFAYRVRSLAKVYRVTLVSHYPLTQPEFAIANIERRVLPYADGRTGWISYMLACARMIRARRPACAVLLHSLLAPMVLMTGKIPTALYWNEHPSRLTAAPPGHPAWKRLARKIALHVFFMHAAKRADLVMPIGEAQQEELLRLGCCPEAVQLIYMGVDSSFAQAKDAYLPPAPAKAPLELVYNGTVNSQRGRDVMLEAIAETNRERCIARLRIVGASKAQIDYCEEFARQHGLGDAITVYGRIPGREIPAFLQRADFGMCFMEDLPWWRFNPPTKLFEYLAAGVPVLANNIPTHTQYVKNSCNGMICRYDSHSLAAVLREAWENRTALPSLKHNARQSGAQYMWDRIEADFLLAVRTIAQAPGDRLAARGSVAICSAAGPVSGGIGKTGGNGAGASGACDKKAGKKLPGDLP